MHLRERRAHRQRTVPTCQDLSSLQSLGQTCRLLHLRRRVPSHQRTLLQLPVLRGQRIPQVRTVLLQRQLLLDSRSLQKVRHQLGLQRCCLRVLARLQQRRQRKLRQEQLQSQLLRQRKVRRWTQGLRLRSGYPVHQRKMREDS